MKKSLRRNKRKLELMLLSNPEYFNHQANILKKEITNAKSEEPQKTFFKRETRLREGSNDFPNEWEAETPEESHETGLGIREDLGQIDDG